LAREEYDYVVVGAGSAGCVMAARLSEDRNVRVLLLEAGGPDRHVYLKMPATFVKSFSSPRFNWGYTTQPEPGLGGRSLFLPRGKVMGGSSSINGMFYMRGHPRDYDEWSRLGAKGWAYAEILPYFRRLETSWRGESEYHGASGPIRVRRIDHDALFHDEIIDAARAAGFPITDDLGGAEPEGFSVGEVTIDDRGRRCSAAAAYIKPAAKRANLTIITHALARKIVIKDRRATGIEYEVGGEIKLAHTTREVILSGGVYNSPHLLMLSGIGPGEMLERHGIPVVVDNPAVGANLSEHINVPVEFAAKGPISLVRHLRWDRVIRHTLNWALRGRGLFSTLPTSGNSAVRTDPSLDRPDIQIMTTPLSLESQPWFPWAGKRQRHTFWAAATLLHPHSRGHVALTSANPRDLPAVQLNLLTDRRDLEPLRRGIRAIRKLYRAGAQGRITGAELTPGLNVQSDDEIDSYMRETAYVTQHPVGTCTMGSGPAAVVDSELRVIGIDGLRVVDASVMPTVPGANTNIPTIMIAEKAADMVRGLPPLPRGLPEQVASAA
jgi:choline dehydrogenase